ncbi:hypothetical protein CEP53_007710 [Fusarium sp. AF-6]|nr:hypothetical protein CEP53_007710 [Fusarium sp. AF-6]
MVPMLWNKTLLFSLQAVLLTATATKLPLPVKSSLPSIDVTLTPYLNVKNATIRGRVPSAQYTKKSLKASDSHGPLELSQVDGSAADGTPSRFWVAERGTMGPVVVEFETKPRQVQENTKMGPLFDIRQNGQGLLGSAWGLVPLPPNDTAEYQFSLKWNLQHSPPGSRGVWTWGESPETVRFFNYSSNFWKDPGTQPSRVFVRHNDNVGSGGTALTRSFTFGWFNESSTTDERLKFLLAHEMTHNWPAITAGNDSAISRYAEGATKYYSLRLLWRNGQISTEVYLQAMNTRIEAYYLNPYVNLSDKEAYDQSWVIPQAQTIPYGRGLIYLTNVDGEMRAASNGTESLDTITLSLAAVAKYEAVGTGKPLIKPASNSLGPCFEVIQTSTQPVVYQWKLKFALALCWHWDMML